jgi:hypothetical protein
MGGRQLQGLPGIGAAPASGLPALTRPLSLLVVVDMPAQGGTPAQVPLQRSPINLCAVVPAAGEQYRCHALSNWAR